MCGSLLAAFVPVSPPASCQCTSGAHMKGALPFWETRHGLGALRLGETDSPIFGLA
jgi:hypothetical protein